MNDITAEDVNLVQRILAVQWDRLDRERRHPVSLDDRDRILAEQHRIEEVQAKLWRIEVA